MPSDIFVHDTYIDLGSPYIAGIVVCLVATILIGVYIAYVDDPTMRRMDDPRPAGKRRLRFTLKQFFIAVTLAAVATAIAKWLVYIWCWIAAC